MQHYDFEEGEILLFDKPLKWTSFDVVNKVRTIIKHATQHKTKVGHAGTLDPMATGLLILCTGKKTKIIQELQAFEKEYTGEFIIGQATPSYDTETEVHQHFSIEHLDDKTLLTTAQQFIGKQMQMPPMFSAVKVKGKRLYEHARAGREIVVEPRNIEIFEFELTDIQLPKVHFRVKCSKGTYIRSLAHDFGEALQSGAYLSQLCRTKIGEYDLQNAMQVQDFKQQFQEN